MKDLSATTRITLEVGPLPALTLFYTTTAWSLLAYDASFDGCFASMSWCFLTANPLSHFALRGRVVGSNVDISAGWSSFSPSSRGGNRSRCQNLTTLESSQGVGTTYPWQHYFHEHLPSTGYIVRSVEQAARPMEWLQGKVLDRLPAPCQPRACHRTER